MCKDRFAFCQTLALGDFHGLASDLEPWGYRPICVRPYSAEGKVLVAAAWVRDGLGWKFEKDMTIQELELKNKVYRAEWEKCDKGFLPVDIACYLPPPRPGAQAENAAGLVPPEQPRYACSGVAALARSGRQTDFPRIHGRRDVRRRGRKKTPTK